MGDLAKKLGLTVVEEAPRPRGTSLAAQLGLEEVEDAAPIDSPQPVSSASPAVPPVGNAERTAGTVSPAPAPAPAPDAAQEPGLLESLGLGALNTLSFGFDDEAAGAGAKLAEAVHEDDDPEWAKYFSNRVATRSGDKPAPSSYEAARDAQHAAHDAAAEANPKTYFAGQLAGALPTMVIPGAQGANAGARALNVARTAVPAGALFGVGESRGENAQDVFFDALAGGEGAALVAPAAQEAIYQAVSRFAPAVKDFLLRRVQKEGRVRAAYGPKIDDALAANAPTEAGASLRSRALRGGDAGAIEEHAEALRQGLAELAGDAAPASRATDPKVLDDYAARVRSDLESLWPDRDLALRGIDDKVHEAYARELKSQVDDIWHATDWVKWNEDISSKGQLVSKLLRRDGIDPASVIADADRLAGNVEMVVQELQQFVEPGTADMSFLKKLLREVKEYQRGSPAETRREWRSPYTDAGDKFLRLDQVKREFQKALSSARERRDSPIISELEKIEEQLRTHLERADVWGPGSATLQQVRNASWRDRLLLNSRDADPRRLFLSDASGQASADPYKPLLQGDPEGLLQIVKGADDFASSDAVNALRRWAEREAKLADALSDHLDPDPSLRTAAQHARKRAQELNATLDRRVKEAQAARSLEAAGPKLARDPQKLLSLLRDPESFASSDDVKALRGWLEELADQPYNEEPIRKAVAGIESVLQERAADLRAAPTLKEPGPLLASDRARLLELVRGAGDYARADELQALRAWIEAQASKPGATDRHKQLAAELASRLDTRIDEAAAARLLSGIGSPTQLPETTKGRLARKLPFGVGDMIEEVGSVPDLGKNAETLARLEQALGLGNDPAVREALRRVFGNVASNLRTPRTPPSRMYAAPLAGPAATSNVRARRDNEKARNP